MIAGYATSRHLLVDRADRLLNIATTVGFGEIIYKQKLEDQSAWAVFTNTGVMLITDIHDSFIVTMYLPTVKQVIAIFNGYVPSDLYKVLVKNEKMGYVKV